MPKFKVNLLEAFKFSTISLTMSMNHKTAPSTPESTYSLKSDDEVGVGLSDPQLSDGRRRMLDLVNRLHSTGYVAT